MRRLAWFAVAVGGLASVAIFRVASFPLGMALAAPLGTVVALALGNFFGGLIAAKLAKHDLVFNAALASWSSVVLIAFAIPYAAAVNGTRFEPATLAFLLVEAISFSGLGGFTLVRIRGRRVET